MAYAIAPNLITLNDQKTYETEMTTELEKFEATTDPQTIHILLDHLPETRKELNKLVHKTTHYGNPNVNYSIGTPYQERETHTQFDNKKIEMLDP